MKICTTVIKCGKFGEIELVLVRKGSDEQFLMKFKSYDVDVQVESVEISEENYILMLDKFQSNVVDYREVTIPTLQ